MSLHPALRLTPSNSPFYRPSLSRSPTKQQPKYEEAALHLKKVIGTTTASINAFDCLPAARQFAFTAGAAAVLATVDPDLTIKQQFFRANPTTTSNTTARDGSTVWPVTPTPSDARNRALGHLRDQNGGISPLSASLRDWSDSPNGRSTTARDRVKAATSVALSPNGKWLAIGETGYKPRVLIFSTRDGSSENPTAVVAEHTFGVHALSFSPDSRFLASLGTVNDGFLYLWSIDDRIGVATLHSSNKCTTTIHAMAWVGRSIVTVGLRFVKVWRPDDEVALDARSSEMPRNSTVTPRQKIDARSDFGNSILSPKHKVLAGKNCLLGDMLEATFTSVLGISETKALICTDGGEVCLLDDSERMQSMTLVATTGIRSTAAMLDKNILRVVGADDSVASFDISDLEKRATVPAKGSRRSSTSPLKAHATKGTTIVATANLGDIVIMIDSNRMISLSKVNTGALDDDEIVHRHLTAHEDSVLGVRGLQSNIMPNAAFFTFSGNGAVRFWDNDGDSVGGFTAPIDSAPDMYGLSNELKAVASSEEGEFIVTGDRFGTLALFSLESGTLLQQVRAHSTEILDVASFIRAGVQFFASASRDRTVQLFACTKNRLELLQTMDEHAGAVTSVMSAKYGDQLLSCSSDRSVVVREALLREHSNTETLAYVMLRMISLRSSPTSMCLTLQDDTVLISAADRCISKYSTKTGQADFSFKCSDNEGGEAVVVSKILYAPSLHGNPTIAAISSSDKSVRLYTEYGSLVARDWGHTEGITDVAFVPTASGDGVMRPPHIVTVAADSTIFLWESIVSNNRSGTAQSFESTDIETPITNTLVPLGPPLRKVISHSEISRFRRERPADENDPPSPTAPSTSPSTASPHKLRKKPSRLSVAQPPRLEPAFRSSFRDTSRRRSNRNQSPSPPSPRAADRKDIRRPSLGISLRSKSTENIQHTSASASNAGGFGTLTASTDSVCRTLRIYRKKLTTSAPQETISPDMLRELEKELKLTARVVGEKSAGKTLDEAVMARLLDQASDKLVGLLDGKIRQRVENELRKTSEGGMAPSASPGLLEPPAEMDEGIERSETAPPAL